MSRSVVKQPDGKYSIFSSVVDDWIITDATREEVIIAHQQDAIEQAFKEAERALERQTRISYRERLSQQRKMDCIAGDISRRW